MAIKTYNDQNFVAIANAIRAKNGETTQYKPSEMAAAISALETALELLPQDTVSGSIANFPDGSNNYPVVELIANIAPSQAGSGDPAPDNVRPISGYTGMNIYKQGKNLLPNKTYQRTNNTLRIGTDTLDGRLTLKAGTYTVSIKTSLIGTFSYYDDRTGTTNAITTTATANGRKGTFTLSSDGTYFIQIYVSAGVTAADVSEIQLESGSTATAFEAYSDPEVKSISWESEAGTVYGGTLNVTTGELTVINARKKISDFGTWSYVTNYDGYFQAPKGDMKEAVDNFTPLDGLYCEVYKTATSSAAGSGKVNYTIASGSGAAAGLRIRNNDYSDVQSFLAAFGDYYIVYPLATPEVYQLEPEEVKTLLGVNNIYADTGDVEVTYRADIDLYIAKKIAEGA